MLPTIAPIHGKNVVENHRAQPQHNEFPNMTNSKRGVKPIVFQGFPPGTILIAEGRDIFSENVPQEAKLEAFVERIGRHDRFFRLTLDQ